MKLATSIFTYKTRLTDKIAPYLQHSGIYHILFWLLLYLVLISMDSKELGLFFALGTNLITISFFILIVYLNFFYLFPQYLQNKSLFWHLVSLAVAATMVTPIKSFILYFVYYDHPEKRSFILENQGFFFLSFFFLGVGSSIYNIMNEWIKGQRDTSELKNKTLQSELNFLKSQINPHFLFNTLNNLYALTLKKSDLAPEIVLKLSEMMRYMLYECNERRVPLQKEINYVKNYLELEKLRQGKKFDIQFKLKGNVEDQKIAPLMFIPFLENSFKHGVNNQLTDGFVEIQLDIEKDNVRVDIENSKAPTLPSPSGRKSGGIGLVNVRRRLDLLYPDNYILDIENNPNTYKITLELNLD
jgi:sensor histidine kinase YesM